MGSMVKFFTYFISSGKNGMSLDECSHKIADIFESRKPKVRYALVQKRLKSWILPLLMPPRLVDRFFLKNLM
jgi:hypothetical protein